MPKLQFTPQVWLIVSILVYLIPAVAVYFIFLSPLFEESNQAREDRQAAEEYVILKNTATQLAQFKERIAYRSNTRKFRSSLDTVAVRTNVKIVGVDPDTTVEQLNSGFQFRRYLVTVEGQYTQVNDFLASLELVNNYYTVSNVAVERLDDRTGLAKGSLTMRVLTVPEQKKAEAPKEDATAEKTSAIYRYGYRAA